MADPSVNADTGERQNPAGWSVDDPSVLGGSALRKGMGLIEERQKVGEEEVKALEAKQKAEKPYQDKLKGILDSPVTAHAELQKLQKAPNPEDYKKYTMEFLGAMTLVGAFASRKSRNVGNAALKAFTGAMTGWQQGNLEAYAQATKQWEENTKAVIENNRVELERYREIIENRSLNIEQLKAGLLVAGMESQNAIMVQQLKQGNLDAALKGIDMLTNMQTKLQNAVDPLTGLVTNQRTELAARVTDLNEHPERLANVKYDDFIRVKSAADAYHKIDPNFPQLKDPGQQAQFQQAGSYSHSPQALAQSQAIGRGIMEGKQPPALTGLYGLSGPTRAYLEEQGFDLAGAQLEWERAKKQVQVLNGPQMTRFVGLATSVVNTIDEVRDLSRKMQLSGVPAFNHVELQRYIQTEGNSENGKLAARYIAAVGTLKEEFANLANGGYAPTEPAWRLANTQINENYGVGELDASLTEVQRLIRYRVNAIPGLGDVGAGAPNRYMPGGGREVMPEGKAAPASQADPLGIR